MLLLAGCGSNEETEVASGTYTDPETGGWLFRVTLADAGELDGMMDQAAYNAYVAGL